MEQLFFQKKKERKREKERKNETRKLNCAYGQKLF